MGRVVEICFDNDVESNDNVRLARNTLGFRFSLKGATVVFVHLPEGEENKGLDDFLGNNSPIQKALKAYNALPREECIYSVSLNKINSLVAYCPPHGCFVDLEHFVLIRQNLVASNRIKNIPMFDENNRKVDPLGTWLEWENRYEIQGLTYEPGAEEVIIREKPVADGKSVKTEIFHNTWTGWGVESVKGDVGPFLTLLNHLVPRKVERDYLLQWLAYPIVHPGAKLFQAVFIWSTEEGTGKTFLGEIIRDIYGVNGGKANNQNLLSTFNDWRVNKQFILADEIIAKGDDRRQQSTILKNMITQESVNISAKFQPSYELTDCVNYFFTSNHPNGIMLTSKDRRFFVINANEEKLTKEEYHRIHTWRKQKNKAGVSALRYYLENEVDLKTFNPKAAPPDTDAKKMTINMSMTEAEEFSQSIIQSPEALLKDLSGFLYPKDWYDMEELWVIARNHHINVMNKTSLKNAIVEMGAWGKTGVMIKQPDGTYTSKNLWCLRNIKTWRQEATKGLNAKIQEDYESYSVKTQINSKLSIRAKGKGK